MSAALDIPERRTLLELARSAIVDRVLSDGTLERCRAAAHITPTLEALRGAFVTLHVSVRSDSSEPHRLRGCIGSITSQEPLHRNVIRNAVRSAFEDPRFPALDATELERLEIEISALTPLRPVRDPASIVAGRDGVHLEHGKSSAVFLPQVAVEQGWDATELLQHLAIKAGLSREGWRDAGLEVFQAEVFGEASPNSRNSR